MDLDLIYKCFSSYLSVGACLVVIDILVLRINLPSFKAALRASAVRCGLPSDEAVTRSVAYNAAFALMSWPYGVIETLRNLGR